MCLQASNFPLENLDPQTRNFQYIRHSNAPSKKHPKNNYKSNIGFNEEDLKLFSRLAYRFFSHNKFAM